MKQTIIIFIGIFSFYAMVSAEENMTTAPELGMRNSEFGIVDVGLPTNHNHKEMPRSLFADLKASRIGDIVTVLVMESASASKNATTKTSKSSKWDMQSSVNPVKGELSAESAHNGSGSTSRSGEITASVPAIVIQVLPNGNLLIVGKRDLIINTDKETISVRGILRRQDITPSNTVLSTQLADAKIQYEGDGLIARQQRPGLLGRILDWLWIF